MSNPQEHVVRPTKGKDLTPDQIMSERIYQAFPDESQREIIAELMRSRDELTYYVAQTRYACDCIFNFISNGMAPGIPWEDMGTHADEGDAPPQQPPSRAQRRQAARSMAKRMTNVEGE